MKSSFLSDNSSLESYGSDSVPSTLLVASSALLSYFLKIDALVPTAHTGVIKLADFGVALRQSETVKNAKNAAKTYVSTCCRRSYCY
jgi:hypothetical protein